MTDDMDALPPPEPGPALMPSTKGPSRMRWFLAFSLMLNLAVAGFVIGDALDGGLRGQRGMPRDMSFGPFSEALAQDDRKTLARALFDKAPDLRRMRQDMRDDLDLVIAALEADPFNPAALDTALSAQTRRVTQSLDLTRAALHDLVVAMSAADRLAFAARLKDHWHGPGQD